LFASFADPERLSDHVPPVTDVVAVCVGVVPHVHVAAWQNWIVTVVVSLAVPVNGPPPLKPLAPFVGLVIESVGAVRSTVYTAPVAELAELPAVSFTDDGLERLTPSVPSPLPAFTVTV
jgi:hypothetical protein